MKITRTATPKKKPEDESKLGFGRLFTDHMFLMHAVNGVWDEGEILPYGPLAIDPASTVLHYGQEVFEGMKAYKAVDGRTLLFRPRDNFERMNISAARLCMPALDVERALSSLVELVKLEEDWIPKQAGTSLYIRPNMFGNDAKLGVNSASNVVFNIILSFRRVLRRRPRPHEDLCGAGIRPRGPRRHGLHQGGRELRRFHAGRVRSPQDGLRPGALAGRRGAQIR